MKLQQYLLIAILSFISISTFAEVVNINKADADVLKHYLKGIGKKKAAKIIKYRQQHKKFKTIAEIMEVKGIGKGIFKKIKADLSLTEGVISFSSSNKKAVKIKKEVKEKQALSKSIMEKAEIKQKNESKAKMKILPKIDKSNDTKIEVDKKTKNKII